MRKFTTATEDVDDPDEPKPDTQTEDDDNAEGEEVVPAEPIANAPSGLRDDDSS